MKRKFLAVSAAAILLAGCAPTEDKSSVTLYETESTTSATTTARTEPEMTYSQTRATTAYTETEPGTDTTGAETGTTAASSPEETGTTSGTEVTTAPPEDTETTATTTTIPEGAVRCKISGIAGAIFYCLKDPAGYCSEQEGKTVFDLRRAAEAAGFRRVEEDDRRWQFRKDDVTAEISFAAPQEQDNGDLLLTEIRYTFGEQSIVLSQVSPRKAQFVLSGTDAGMTADQVNLTVYLTEQLAKSPEKNPLAGMVPQYLSEKVNGEDWYFLP